MEDIEHDEPAAVLSQEETAVVAQTLWAGYVERFAMNYHAGSGGLAEQQCNVGCLDSQLQLEAEPSDHTSNLAQRSSDEDDLSTNATNSGEALHTAPPDAGYSKNKESYNIFLASNK